MPEIEENNRGVQEDPFAHLKQRASERADRTVDRIRAAIAALKAGGQKITAESLQQVTRDLEPGFVGLSFQVIRRNPRAYALYREAADAFTSPRAADDQRPGKLPGRSPRRRAPRSSYDPLQRLDKRELVHRIRALEQELNARQERRAALAYDQQALRAKDPSPRNGSDPSGRRAHSREVMPASAQPRRTSVTHVR